MLKRIESPSSWKQDSLQHLREIRFALENRIFAIETGTEGLENATMSIEHHPRLIPFVPDIARYLYLELRESGIVFDAIANVPRGGNAWAEALVDCARADGRKIPLVRLSKSSDQEFYLSAEKGSRPMRNVLLVDDVVHSGKKSSRALNALTLEGHRVVGLACPCDVFYDGERLWDEKKYPMVSLFNSALIKELRS